MALQRGTKESLSLYGISKRKVKCEKYGNAYKFLIEISFIGELQGNNMYENLYTDTSVKKEVEDEIA